MRFPLKSGLENPEVPAGEISGSCKAALVLASELAFGEGGVQEARLVFPHEEGCGSSREAASIAQQCFWVQWNGWRGLKEKVTCALAHALERALKVQTGFFQVCSHAASFPWHSHPGCG